MQLSHTRPVKSEVFDDPNLVSSAGLVPLLALARSANVWLTARRQAPDHRRVGHGRSAFGVQTRQPEDSP